MPLTSHAIGDTGHTADHNLIVAALASMRPVVATYDTGSITVTSTTVLADLPGISNALDVTLAAAAGDVLEVGFNALWDSGAATGFAGAATIVSGSAVNQITGAHVNGVAAWTAPGSAFAPIGGSVFYTVVSGDISGGNVLLRPQAFATATKQLIATTTSRSIQFWARNWRQ